MKIVVMVLTILLVAALFSLQISQTQATSIRIHKVTYQDYDGNVIASIHYATGADLDNCEVPDAPMREGYIFIGWSHALTGDMPDADIVIFAQYMQSELRVVHQLS